MVPKERIFFFSLKSLQVERKLKGRYASAFIILIFLISLNLMETRSIFFGLIYVKDKVMILILFILKMIILDRILLFNSSSIKCYSVGVGFILNPNLYLPFKDISEAEAERTLILSHTHNLTLCRLFRGSWALPLT